MRVVRGAYGKRKNEKTERGQKSPICESKEATDINYDTTKLIWLSILIKWLFAGTHNESSPTS